MRHILLPVVDDDDIEGTIRFALELTPEFLELVDRRWAMIRLGEDAPSEIRWFCEQGRFFIYTGSGKGGLVNAISQLEDGDAFTITDDMPEEDSDDVRYINTDLDEMIITGFGLSFTACWNSTDDRRTTTEIPWGAVEIWKQLVA